MARDLTVLQRAFDSLCAHFNRVGLKTNTSKTGVMVFLPGRILTCLTVDAYEVCMGDLYHEDCRGHTVSCQEYGQQMAMGSLLTVPPQDTSQHLHLVRVPHGCRSSSGSVATRGDLHRRRG